jgi:diadenosine tetraphosphate (Ap4A) HIT family hydrolase
MGDACPFCEIVAGDRHQEVVYQDAAVVAFLCEPPAVWGHVLVVPRRHVADLWSIEMAELAAVTTTAKRIADALRTAVEAEGISLRQNSGTASGQDVSHFHVHVIPRHEGDSLGNACVWGAPPWEPPRGGAKQRVRVAEAIRQALAHSE